MKIINLENLKNMETTNKNDNDIKIEMIKILELLKNSKSYISHFSFKTSYFYHVESLLFTNEGVKRTGDIASLYCDNKVIDKIIDLNQYKQLTNVYETINNLKLFNIKHLKSIVEKLEG